MISGSAPTLAAIDTAFITNGDREQTLVALTFDICESEKVASGYDTAIEATLVELEAPATFFISGHWMTHNIETVRRLANNPLFEIGNHSWSHPDFRDLDAVQLDSQIVQANDIFYQLTGQQMQYFRLPGGTYYPWILDAVAEHGMLTIQWDVVTGDPVPDNDAENINRIVQDRVQNGSIIIMHANGRGWHTAEALPDVIDWLRERGYTLVTISDLLDAGK
jgi:peptidoglycan/xylan/chitin deacetylase (PgdA/CDA1 family)